jgi:hypothetical protein
MLGPHPAGTITVGASFDGIDFNGSNCGCLPPDTNADVGGNYVVEVVNIQIRVFDKTGTVLMDEPLQTFFGAFSGGDPEVVYDDIANRWYVSAFDSSDSGLFLAVSKDANPLDGFMPTYDLTNVGGFPDYNKMGFNKDAIFISFNNFGSGGAAATVASINKADALSGTLTYFVSTPPAFQFRAMPPARMHGDTTGGVEWFVSTDGTDSGGTTMRVTELTNYLSNSPVYTLTSLPVAQYQSAGRADQPGAPFGVTTFPNTTTYEVQYRNGHLVTAMASATAADGFTYPKGLYYEVDVSGGTPVLQRQGVIDPGAGVAVQMPSVDVDPAGNLGLTWFESSLSEYLSMWVGSVDPAGNLTSFDAAPGGGFFPYSFRIGDYSSTIYDSSSGSFWSANEYIGSDGFSDIWRTHITSFHTQLTVTSSDPAADSVIATTPTDFTITWSDAIDPNSLNANDLAVNGIVANSVTLSPDLMTTVFHYDVSPVTAEGLQTMDIGANTIRRLSDGTGNLPFHVHFRYDPSPMSVTATNPTAGAIDNISNGTTNLIVDFSEAFDPTTINTGNIQVSLGTVTAATVTNPGTNTEVDYTISNITGEGTENYSLATGAITDADGNPVLAYSSNFIVNIVTSPYPVPLAGKAPLGSLIYDPSVSAGIQFVGDTDSFTINLNPGQTITVDLTTDPSLQGQIDVFNPGGTNIGEVIASGAGAEVVLGPVATDPPTPGIYTIQISGANSTTGNFTAQLILNAALDSGMHDGANNDTLATAQSLDSPNAFINTGSGSSRAAVLGSAPTPPPHAGPDPFGYEAIAVTPTFTDISSDPNAHAILQGTDDSGYYVPFSSLSDPATGNPFSFNFYGQTYSGTSDSLHDHMFINTDGWMTFQYYEAYYFFGGDFSQYPTSAAIGPMWNDTIFIGNGAVYYEVIDPTGTDPQLVIEWQNVQGFYYPGPGFTFEMVLDQNTGHIQFNYGSIAYGTPYDNGALAGVGIKDFGYGTSNHLTISYQQGPNAFINSNQSTLIGLNILPPSDTDFYSLNLNAGDSISVAGKGLAGGSMELLDGSGNELALAATGFAKIDQYIKSFVAPSAGTYYIEVNASPLGGNYSLVVTKNADFDHGGNTRLNQAQSLDGTHTVLGGIGKAGALYGLEWEPSLPLLAHIMDPQTGAFQNTIDINAGFVTNPFGENMAFDGTNLYYNDGPFFGDNRIYKIDPATGNVISSILPQEPFYLFGIAWFNGAIWATDSFNLYELDPNTGVVIKEYGAVFDGAATGLTADPDNGLLYAVSQFREFFVVDPTTGTVVKRAPDNPLYYEQDLAYANGELFVSEAFVFGVDTISVYDANTLQLKRRLPENGVPFFIGGLGGDGLGGTDAHYYSFNANDLDNLTITDTAFNSSENGNTGEFANGLQPVLALFDSSGTQVATATDDGTGTATISYMVPMGAGGTYYVEATAQNKTEGEYTLDVEGATGAATPFTVVSTDPANGSNLQSADHITVTFSESVLISSLALSDFTIDGNPATSVTVVDDHTVTFNFSPLPTGPEDQVTHSWSISGVLDLQGDIAATVSGSFILDNVPPQLLSSTISNGQIFTDGSSVTDVLTFSEPMNTALVTGAAFQLLGTYRGVSYSPASLTWDPTNTILTVTYKNLPDDGYTGTLFASFFQDPVGLTLLGGDQSVTFTIDGTGPFALPTPVQSVSALGSLVYTTSATGVVLPTGDHDTFTIDLNAGQHLTIDATTGSTFDAHILVKDPTNHIIAHGDGAVAGAEVVMQSIPITNEGTYQIVVSGLLDTLGYYSMKVILNAALELSAHGGPSNGTQGSSQDLTNAFTGVGFNGESIATVLGQTHAPAAGDLLWVGSHSLSWNDGSVSVTQISLAQFATESLSGFRAIWVDADALDFGGLNILQSRAADIAAFVSAGGGLITDTGGAFFNPNFSWVPLSSSLSWNVDTKDSVVETALGMSHPILAGITNAGLSNWGNSQHNDFPATAGLNVLATDPEGDADILAGSFGAGKVVYMGVDPSFHGDFNEGQSRQLILQSVHWAEAPRVAVGGDFFSFDAVAGQSVSVAVAAAAAGHARLTVTLLDSTGAVVALGATGAANVDSEIANFLIPADDTYYVSVGGPGGTPFSLTVTEDAVFDTENNGTKATAQDITPTINPTLGVGGAAIGSLSSSAVNLGASIEGIDFNGSNCGCLPPDTNAAVGGNYVVETVNVQVRIFDKTTGSVLLDEPLSTLFGEPSGGDVYVVYDDIANRWYVVAFNGNFNAFLLVVSKDANPLDGFLPTYHVSGNSSFPDYPKMGFNADAIFISFNDFGTDAGATIISINKADALSGTLTEFVSKPKFQFRAMPPAQMHGDTTGGVEWFVSTDGTDAGGNTMRVTEMTNYLSNSPVFTYTSLPVTQYQQAVRADQPDGSGVTVFPNTTTTQVQYHNGVLVTAMASALAGDGFTYPKGLYYQIDVSSGSPVLLRQGVIDPGPGVAVQMPTVDEDSSGNLGFTWIESSSSENLSMWVGTLNTSGAFASAVAAPGGGPFVFNFRIGDYSSTVLDPDGKTFWSANEYIGSDGSSDIWRTHIESFSVAAPIESDFYSVNVNNGDNVTISVGAALPGGGEPGSQQASPIFNLTDPNGTVLASGVQTYNFLASVPGTYYIEVTQDTSAPNFGQGDYALDVSGATGGPNPLTVTGTNPAAGAFIQPPASITVDFSAGINLTSVSAADLTIDGMNAGTETATGFTINNDHEVTFTLPQDFPINDRGTHNITITGVQALTGVTVTTFTESITVDNLAPAVVNTSIQEGGVATGPDLTYMVTFSEPMNTSFTTAAAFALHGNFLNTGYAASSFSWDSTGTVLTINYTGLPDDTYHLSLFSSGFQDLVGLALSGDPPWVGHPQTFNTGVDNSGNVLPDNSVDPHYTIFSSPQGNNLPAYVINRTGFPFPPGGAWIPDSSTSAWLSPDPGAFQSSYGVYDYRTTVDLTGFDPTTAVLTGRTAVDDNLQNILVNGQSTGISGGFDTFIPYTIGSSYFHAGVNTIDFLIFEYPCCQGFRNEMSLSAVPSPVPAADQIPPAQSGNGLPGGDFFVDFTVDDPGPYAFPTPTTPVKPLGSLIYQGPQADPVTVSLYSGFNTAGGGAPYSGFVATLHAPDVQFGTDTNFNWHPNNLFQFGADITGDLNVAANGTYSFKLNSDDGSVLFIDGSQVVFDGNPHGPTVVSGSATLSAGIHRFEIQFFECCGGGSGVDLTLPSGVSYASGAATGVIAPAGDDSDSYTININANETATVDFLSSSLQGQVTVTDHLGNVIGTASAGAVGQEVVLQTAPIATTDTYTITVNDVSGTNTGLYHLQVYLNAALDNGAHGGGENSTIGTAQDISGSSVALGTGGADRLGVLGTFNGTADVYSFHLAAGQTGTLAAKIAPPPAQLFAQRTDYSTDSGPNDIAFGDLNGDGKPDMVTANTFSDDVTVRFNNGDGTFGAPVSLGFAYFPESVVLADVNGDGNLDIITANFYGAFSGGNITVWLNDGHGNFTGPISTFLPDPYNYGLAVGDFNGDGKLDVAVTSFYDWNVDVAYGNGDGTFTFNNSYSTGFGSYPEGIAAGDLNHDGHLDLATANFYGAFNGSGSVSVFLNNGDGTFAAAAPYNASAYNYRIAIGDDKGTGFPDIATTNYYYWTVTTLENNGNGTFTTGNSYNTGPYPQGVTFADVNSDGKLDLLTANYYNSSFSAGSVSVFLGKGDGTYNAATNYDTGYGTQGVAAADVNGDGFVDLGTANQGSNTETVLLNQFSIANLELVDASGNVLATATTGPTNVDQVIENFVAPSDGTYYAEIVGAGTFPRDYSLTVTRGATFALEPNDKPSQAQNITTLGGVLGHLELPAAVSLGTSFDGIDFNGSNCGCLPPDTDAAVGGNYVVEMVNIQIRVFDKTTGNILLDEPLATFFGAFSGGDPYVVYDDIANRWYAEGLDSSDGGFFLAVSNDANPLHGFAQFHLVNGLGGPITDYPKMGFNKDAVFISYNNFGSGGAAATVVSIDKNALLSGTLTYFVSTPPVFQFRAMPPAQMHGDTTGGVEWFLSTDGTDAGGTTIRVTELTNYLSNSPVYTLTSLPVAQYQSASRADQPGGGVTTFPNTTTTQVQYQNGMLVTAMASATAADGFVYPKGLYYEVNVSGPTPTLALQGVIDPGTGVAVQMPSVAFDSSGNLGFTWMESSSSEYLSMWVGTLNATSNAFASAVAAPGGGFFPYNFRIGDYSTTVLDPDGHTFWSANEYIGNNGYSDIWLTHITSFSLVPPVSHDYYEIDAAQGATINLATFTPSDQGAEFENTLDPGLALYDANGNLVASETTGADGRNETITYTVPAGAGGRFFVDVFNEGGTFGEYFLQSSISGPSAVAGRKFNDLLAQGTDLPTDPGLAGWIITLSDTSGNLVAATVTDAQGNYVITTKSDGTPLGAGTYVVQEQPQSGWTESYPAAGSYTITVIAGQESLGNDFGNWHAASISGRKFNDLNGSGVDDPSDPGLAGWTIDLVNPSTGAVVDSTTTASDGSYSFPNEHPGNYIVEEVQQTGYLQTFPAAPGTYPITANSNTSTTGLDFGNFQLATISGTVFNDVNGNGIQDSGDLGTPGWTVDLFDSHGNLVQSQVTDVNGNFNFMGVGPGTFTIQEAYQVGFVETTTPTSYSVTTMSGSATTGLLFGNFQDVTVSGTVYNDLNGSGSINPSDPGLQNWLVTLDNTTTNVIRQLLTDVNGNYSFAYVGPGNYTLTETLQSGWVQTQPGTPSSPQGYTLTPSSGANVSDNFGNYALATSTGVVYNDTDGNGVLDNGESGIPGVTVDLLNASTGAVVQSSVTDSNGNYLFTNVGPGSYTISEEIPFGYIFTQPAAPYTYAYNPTSGSSTTGQDFGNVQAGTISGRTFNDLNGSGQDLGSDPGLGGWTIDLVNSGGTVVATTTTASDGSYSFTALLGSYTVEEVPQSGYTQTYPAAPGTYSVTLSSGGQTVSGNDFGEFQNISFSGTVFYDRNNDHTQDNGETGISGVQIKLDGTVVATTGADGSFSISNIGPGSHSVTEVVPSRYIETSPSNNLYSFTPQSGSNLTSQNFANDVPYTTHDNNRQGYNESGGGWVTLNQGWNGTSRTHAATTRHAVYASWNLNPMGGNLPPGTYQVYVTWVPASDRATNATYEVFDGNNHLIATVRVDQTQTPSGAWYQGFYWQSLGIFNFTANKPSVRLLGSASGSVDADGVLILSTPSSGHPALASGTPGTSLTGQNMAAAVLASQTSGSTAGSTQTSSAAALTVQPNGVSTDVVDQMVRASSMDTVGLVDYLFATQKQNNNGLGDFTDTLILGQL